ncbi:hypothetical protein CLV84_1703 [Neolewinella xylanilytica]|uniref:Uncharacterized protein n=1 Tax=Neolewinella xylanilytica TaxID=1514080 RepID=A0A2S6IB90_9BACT|nr:hypothetical protein [Neolewinella xylanilytica]PPK88732.1 hypothetical protein CLV84_1703 [Neolewinella xylanilytica]
MSPASGVALLFPVFVFSCAPAPESDPGALPPDRVYALTEVRPLEFLNEGGRYGMLRLEISGDSARIYNPFTEYSQTLAAILADGAQETTDSVYLSYIPESDSTLSATLHTPAQIYQQRYRAVDAIPQGGWPTDLVGHTYRIVRDTGNWVVHLADIGGQRDKASMRILQSQLLQIDESDGRQVAERTYGFGMVEGERVYTSFLLPGGEDEALMRPKLAVTGQSADGKPALYVLGRDTINAEPVAVYHLEPYPSLLPEEMDEMAILDLLNRSRMVVGELPAEPDSIGIAYQVEVREHDPVLKRAEVAGIDIAFTADGAFTLFAGERIARQGRWSISPDRNFFFFLTPGMQAEGLTLISDYNESFLAFPLPLDVETERPRGVRLRSYYHPLVDVKFYHTTESGDLK